MKHAHPLPALLIAAAFTALLALASGAALAGPGHDHGDTLAPAIGLALPRFAAESEDFELVGIVDGQQVTLYLDRFADGSPVTDARIELDLDGRQLIAAAGSDGEFTATLPDALPPGLIPVTATIFAGDQSDLLAGELDIHQDVHADAAPAASPITIAAWAGAALAVLTLAWTAWRRQRPGRNGGAA